MPNQFILIGGEERPVNFGRNFWSEVELLTGKTLAELLDKRELMAVRNQIAIAYSSLKWGKYNPKTGNDPQVEFKPAHVGDWIDENPDVMKEFYTNLTSSLPSKKKEEDAENQK